MSKKSPQNFVSLFFRGEVLKCFYRFFWFCIGFLVPSGALGGVVFLEVSDNPHLSLRYSHLSLNLSFDGQRTLFVPGRGSKANLQNSHQHLVLCPCKQVSLGSLSTGSPASHLFFREGSMYNQAHISLFQHLLASVAPCDQGS